MIEVTIRRDRNDKSLKGFRVEGHAGTRPGDTESVVCAAVSVTAQNAVNALEAICGWKGFYRLDQEGMIDCSLPADADREHGKSAAADVILRLTELGFRQIEASYGRYVKVAFKEV